MLTAGTDGVDILWLEQTVVGFDFEALVQQLQINFAGEAHKTDGLVLNLRDKGFIVNVLACNKLSDKVFSVGFGYGFGLRIKDISQVVVVLLLGWTDFNVGDNVDARGKEDLRVLVDTADSGHVFTVLHCELLEESREWVEAMFNVILVGIAAHEEKNADQVG